MSDEQKVAADQKKAEEEQRRVSGQQESSGEGEKVATKQNPGKAEKSVDTIAQEVYRGEWGTGQQLYDRVDQAGYDSNAVREKVEKMQDEARRGPDNQQDETQPNQQKNEQKNEQKS